MEDRDWQLLKQAFDEARACPPEERPAALDRLCADNPEIRPELEAMLAVHDRKEATEGGAVVAPPPEEGPGAVIGPYKLLQQIGEGGFGVVYMAQQTEPVRRKVALKVIRLGMDTNQVVARFEAERQALALMDHPNIAKVLDAGATDTGRPYFVMELVKGVPITEYCDQRKLDTRARLALVSAVCHAVQHAHQKGIIHRDLKPSNVLVTLHDGEPVPKVIDFGIAKAVDRPLTEKTLFTEFRQMIGTPDYMAPEQAELSGLDVDTRADIYSLGVLLYELLTGTKPFDIKSLMAKGYDEILRTIREVDPPLPSTRASTTDKVAPDARLPLARLLRGDLDWIVMKALDKDRARRYETANGLAADIGRYLADEPVRATPPSATYRARKYLRRNRVAVTAAAVVFVAVLLSGGLALWARGTARNRTEAAHAAAKRATQKRAAAEQARARESEQRERARAGAAKAEKHTKRAAAVLGVIRKVLGEGKPSDHTVRALLVDFEREIDGTLRSQPEVEAWIRTAMVFPLLGLGLFERAEVQAKAALEIRREVLGSEHPDYALSLEVLGRVLATKGDDDAAARHYREALEARRKNPADGARIANTRAMVATTVKGLREALAEQRRFLRKDHPYLAYTLNNLGVALLRVDDPAAAEDCLREAAAIERKNVGDDHPGLATNVSNLGHALWEQGKVEEARKLMDEALRLRRKWLPANHPNLARSLGDLGRLLRQQRSFKDAEPLLEEAIAVSQEALGDDHPLTATCLAELGNLHQDARELPEAEKHHRAALAIHRLPGVAPRDLISSITNLGVTLGLADEFDEAEALLREAIERARSPAHDRARAKAAGHLGELLENRGRHREAEELFAEALAIHERLLPANHPMIATSLHNLATAIHARGDYATSAKLAERAVALRRSRGGVELAYTLNTWGLALEDLGRLDEAEKVHREALAIRRAECGPHSRELATSLNNLALVLEQKGDAAGAEKLFRDALKITRKAYAPGHRKIAEGLHNLGWQVLDRGQHAEARKMFEDALEIRRRVFGDDHPQVALSLQSLAQVHRRLKEGDEAMKLFRRVLEIRKRAYGGENNPDVGASYQSIGLQLLDMKKVDEAETYIKRALDIFERTLAQKHPKCAGAIHALGHVAWERGQHDRAEELFRQALVIRRAANAGIAEDRGCMGKLADVVHQEAHKADDRGAPAEAERLHRRALAMKREVGLDPGSEIGCLVLFLGKTDAERLRPFLGQLRAPERRHPFLARLGLMLLTEGKHAAAETLLRRCLDLRTKEVPDSWLRYNAMSMLGEALAGQGKHAEAEPLLIEGFEKMAPPERSANRKRQALERIVKLYEAWGKPNEAAAWRAKQ